MTDTITIHKSGAICFAGRSAVDYYRAAALRSALRILASGMTMRGMTLTRAMKLATEYTGQPYKRGQAEQARDDLSTWLDEAKKHLNITDETKGTNQ